MLLYSYQYVELSICRYSYLYVTLYCIWSSTLCECVTENWLTVNMYTLLILKFIRRCVAIINPVTACNIKVKLQTELRDL